MQGEGGRRGFFFIGGRSLLCLVYVCGVQIRTSGWEEAAG